MVERVRGTVHVPSGAPLPAGLVEQDAAVTDTLRLSATPSIGRRTGSIPSPVQAADRPSASAPSAIASGPVRSASV